ncbi:hypothetical protein [Nocardia sp. NPDC004604]|uniref:hypothetical protein n=1 Tax=Nocardia sp. NPDC004604 TaxID=3157013 RepID=UPI0033B196CC
MTARSSRRVQWGVLIGETVRLLPKARNVTDATLYASKITTPRGTKTPVVYRHSDNDMWHRWIDDVPVPTQLNLFEVSA